MVMSFTLIIDRGERKSTREFATFDEAAKIARNYEMEKTPVVIGCPDGRRLTLSEAHQAAKAGDLMPKGPQGQKRPADAIGLAVMVGRIATGEIEDNVEDRAEMRKAAAKAAATARARALFLQSGQRSRLRLLILAGKKVRLFRRRKSQLAFSSRKSSLMPFIIT